MRTPGSALRRLTALAAAIVAVAVALPALAGAAEVEPGSHKHPLPPKPTPHGKLVQLPGAKGCITGGAKPGGTCAHARALSGPGVGFGSRAIAVSPDGRSIYVAASKSNAIVVFSRDPQTGALRQPKGKAGCVAAQAEHGCGLAIGLIGPNSVAVSPDGNYVYATSRGASSVTSFHRSRKTGALEQLPPSSAGCISGLEIPGCSVGRAVIDPDVVVISPDGKNVYLGAFAGNAVVSFGRSSESGALTQLEGTAGCIALETTSGCAKGVALGAVEGLAVSADGTAVYAASAASSAIAVLGRNAETGALGQATNGTGCLTNAETLGCNLGLQIAGPNAVAVTPRGGVYVTSLTSNSLTSFTQVEAATLVQNTGPAGCLIFLRSAGCAFGRAMVAPEGLAVSPDGSNVYVTAFETGAIDVFERDRKTGGVEQKPGKGGCVAPKTVSGCSLGRALSGAGSIVVSPDGRNVYSTAFASNAVDVFRRIR